MTSRRWRGALPEVAVGATFAGLALGYAAWVAFGLRGPHGPRVGFGPDSQLYLAAAREPIWSRDFLAAPGPFMFPLLAKLCLRNLRAIALVQTGLSVAAWLFLAATVRTVLRSRVIGFLAFGAVLLTALAPRVLEWDAFISTESLSISLLCVVVALGLRVVMGARSGVLGALLVAVAAYAFVRDTNALQVGVLAVLALGAAVASRRARGRAAAVAAIATVSAVTAVWLSNAADPPRSFIPLMETISLRVVGDPVAERWFVEHGMPLDERVRALHRGYFLLREPLLHGNEYARFRRWVRHDGQRTYLGYLLHRPLRTIERPFDERRRLLAPDIEGYSATVVRNEPPAAYAWIGTVGFPLSLPFVQSWIVAAAVGLTVAGRSRRVDDGLTLGLGVVALVAVAGFYAAWHGDALEVDRHALTAAVQLRIALWVTTALVLDTLEVELRGQTRRDPQREHAGRADETEREPVGAP